MRGATSSSDGIKPGSGMGLWFLCPPRSRPGLEPLKKLLEKGLGNDHSNNPLVAGDGPDDAEYLGIMVLQQHSEHFGNRNGIS